MTTKKYATCFTPLMLTTTLYGTKLLDLPAGSVVEATGEEFEYFERVVYCGNKNYVGWVQSAHVEPYVENYATHCVDIKDIQTPSPSDAEQYVLWKQKRQVNMCGELCVAYLLGLRLSEVLENWEVNQPKLFKRIFGGGVASGTGVGDLISLFEMFAIEAEQVRLRRFTPGTLPINSIVGVRINKYNGRLQAGGILHWVVVTDIFPERTGYGFVTLYNPFPNRIERYSWAEFVAAAGVPTIIRLRE